MTVTPETVEQMRNMAELTMTTLLEVLNSKGYPKPVPCSQELRDWWQTKHLPLLLDHALSELRKNNTSPPRLVMVRDKGDHMISINVLTTIEKEFGATQESKDRVAKTQFVTAMVPSVKVCAFSTEAWSLYGQSAQQAKANMAKGIHDHPDRGECIMVSMLHYEPDTHTMMQLVTMAEVIKVLGHNTTPAAWADTKYGEVATTDPHSPEGMTYKGRFVHRSKEDDDDGPEGDRPRTATAGGS